MMQGLAGWMSLTGDPDGPPTKSGLSLVDLSGGYVSAIAVLAGLWRARRDGVGCDCDVSLFETALHELMLRRHLGGVARLRAAAAAQLGAPVDRAVPELRDRRRLDRRRLPEAEVLGAALRGDRAARAAPTRASRRSPTATATATSWSRSSRRSSPGGRATSGWPCSRAAGVPSRARERRRRRARGGARRRVRASGARYGAPGGLAAPPVRRGAAGRAGAARGEHTAAVLAELCGYSPERVRELADAGVFGPEAKGGGNAEALQPDGVARPKPPYSPVVVSGDTVYTAGQIGNDADGNLVAGGIEEQTRRALENVRACLAAAGCTMDDVVKVNAFLASLDDFPGYNEVYASSSRSRTPRARRCRPGCLPVRWSRSRRSRGAPPRKVGRSVWRERDARRRRLRSCLTFEPRRHRGNTGPAADPRPARGPSGQLLQGGGREGRRRDPLPLRRRRDPDRPDRPRRVQRRRRDPADVRRLLRQLGLDLPRDQEHRRRARGGEGRDRAELHR